MLSILSPSFAFDRSKAVPLWQFLFVCASAISEVAFFAVFLYVPRFSFL